MYRSFKRTMNAAKKPKKIANRISKRCFRNKTTTISAKILVSGGVNKEKHGLNRLPPEVKNIIYKALPLNADRACLALTCKDQAAAYEALKTEKNKKGYDHIVPKRLTEIHRLQLLVRLKVDMPRSHRLCYSCVQFIDIKDPDNAGQWGGSEVRVSGGKATKQAMIEGPRCPLCISAKQLENAKHKDTYKKYLALADKVDLKK
ncbi:hypothetical protein H2200_012515 [Cladophialophora chaetospira]|uniref:F-box domain-containing protein n=1 Tax=Cladophialophora chaetospira TaxID=386627 RepID=A0AA38WY03_9EURO|nr:hypothetical protein H2200_012515 [Cladophialophora chaetospira]